MDTYVTSFWLSVRVALHLLSRALGGPPRWQVNDGGGGGGKLLVLDQSSAAAAAGARAGRGWVAAAAGGDLLCFDGAHASPRTGPLSWGVGTRHY